MKNLSLKYLAVPYTAKASCAYFAEYTFSPAQSLASSKLRLTTAS